MVPGASRTSVDGRHGDLLKVRVSAPPERGRANDALVEHLGALLGAEVRIVAGLGARHKRLEVLGLQPGEVVRRLSE